MFDKSELQIQIYVDDPHVAVRGTEAERTRRITVLLLWWQVLGLRLS